MACYLDTHLLKGARDQSAGPYQRHFRSQFFQRPNVRSSHSAKKNISNNRHLQALNCSELFADRKDIQKGLGGVLVGSVSSVDDARLEPVGQEFWCSCRTVTQDDDISV